MLTETKLKNIIREYLWETITKSKNLQNTNNPYVIAEELENNQVLLNEMTDKIYNNLEKENAIF